MDIKNTIYRFNTRNGVKPKLSDWFENQLDLLIEKKYFHDNTELLRKGIVAQLKNYSETHNINNIVLGMSGGIDSALTASLFKKAGWTVTGCTLPINQEPEETLRGREACRALEIEHMEIDLSEAFYSYLNLACRDADPKLHAQNFLEKAEKIRAGNIRARLRMITLYNLANRLGGIVGSTDNFSELSAGFWTLHGDVGDVAPIQSLSKSWEVPLLAEDMDVPESIIKATPTDGLGVDSGDEAQFGFSYLQFDIVLYSLIFNLDLGKPTKTDKKIIDSVKSRIKSTAYKRINPVNLDHPIRGRAFYDALQNLDDKLL